MLRKLRWGLQTRLTEAPSSRQSNERLLKSKLSSSSNHAETSDAQKVILCRIPHQKLYMNAQQNSTQFNRECTHTLSYKVRHLVTGTSAHRKNQVLRFRCFTLTYISQLTATATSLNDFAEARYPIGITCLILLGLGYTDR